MHKLDCKTKLQHLQVCILVGCVPSACWPYPVVSVEVSAYWGGCLPWGVYPGVHLPRGVCLETVCLGNVWPGWVCILACNGADTPFRTESQTGVKTLPFPQNSFAGSKKSISVEIWPPTYGQFVLHSEQVWTCPGEGAAQWGPSLTRRGWERGSIQKECGCSL